MSELITYTIYDKPLDYPDKFVIREWTIKEGGLENGKIVALLDSYGQVCAYREEHCPQVLVIPRYLNDDPAVLEVWI